MVLEEFAVRKSFEKNVVIMKFFGLVPMEKFPWSFGLCFFFYYVVFVVPMPILAIYQIWLTTPEERMGKISENIFMVIELGIQIIKLIPFFQSPEKIMYTVDAWKKKIFNTYTDLDKKVLENGVNEYNFVFYLFIFICLIAFGAMVVETFFVTYKLPIEIWLPFDAINDRKMYVIVSTYLHLTTFHCAVTNITIDMLIAGNMLYCATQLKIVKHRIENMYDYLEEDMQKITENLSKSEKETMSNYLIHDRIIKCVDIHDAVARYANELESIFTVIVFSQFLAHIVVISIVILDITKIETMTFTFFKLVFFLMAMLNELFLFCFYGNRLFDESITVSEAIFMSPWYNFDKNSKKSLIILMENAKRPIKLRAAKILDFSLETFLLILRRAYGLLAVLNNY